MSSVSAPVGIASTRTCAPSSPMRMTLPLPNCCSRWPSVAFSAASRAFAAFSTSAATRAVSLAASAARPFSAVLPLLVTGIVVAPSVSVGEATIGSTPDGTLERAFAPTAVAREALAPETGAPPTAVVAREASVPPGTGSWDELRARSAPRQAPSSGRPQLGVSPPRGPSASRHAGERFVPRPVAGQERSV